MLQAMLLLQSYDWLVTAYYSDHVVHSVVVQSVIVASMARVSCKVHSSSASQSLPCHLSDGI